MPDHHDANRARTTTTTTTQLVDAANQINTLAATIDRILATYVDPPNPDKPTAISATNTLLTQAAHITDTANQILRKLNGG